MSKPLRQPPKVKDGDVQSFYDDLYLKFKSMPPIADATNATDVIVQLNALLKVLRERGLLQP